MTLDTWLPIGHKLPDGAKCRVALFEGLGWQILETATNGRALVVKNDLTERWVRSGLLDEGCLSTFEFGDHRLWSISCNKSQILCPVSECKSPDTKSEALAFALAFKATRDIDKESPLQDALYIEKISRLLPTYSISPKTDDDVVLGHWLSGGASVSVKSFRRLRQTLSWLAASHLKEVVEAAGFEVTEVVPTERRRTPALKQEGMNDELSAERNDTKDIQPVLKTFELPGRPDLETFFNEHIVDIVQNRDRYKALGIEFPSAVVLHGPPGCGKTFAVERLVDFLGWPSFQIDASSVASPYIHETSKKVADVFDKAMQNAPAVLVIDEMEAFLADRDIGSGHHRVEEVAEFLRRIPEATKNEVLIVAMTNRIDMIDPAIIRRGRFDHVIKVDFANEAEILSLITKLLSSLPSEEAVDTAYIAKELAGRPLSDVTFVVREGARLAARSGIDHLTQECLVAALKSAAAREREGGKQQRIGFS
jgi:AAA+ superfamily predicted ATPase